MKKKTMVVMGLLLASLLAIGGCATGVSQEEYDSVVAERDAVQAEVANLEDEIEALNTQVEALTTAAGVSQGEYDSVVAERDAVQAEVANLEDEIEELNAQVEALTTATGVDEAWNIAKQRHTTVMQDIPFLDELLELAPWVKFPDKPAWFDSARVCSAILVDEPPAYEGVCVTKVPGQQMFVRLSEYHGITSMICQGGTLDYEMIITQDEDGNIVEEMIKAGESLAVLRWIEEEGEETFSADVNGQVFETRWSDEPEEFADFCSDFVGWLETIDSSGGLITPSDQPLMILGLGELRKPGYAEPIVNWGGVIKRAVSDVCAGVPQTCLM